MFIENEPPLNATWKLPFDINNAAGFRFHSDEFQQWRQKQPKTETRSFPKKRLNSSVGVLQLAELWQLSKGPLSWS